MAGRRGLQHCEGERRPRAFAEPHAEIKNRPLADSLDEPAMTRLGRDMSDHAMVECMWVGEGSGATLALAVLKAAAACHYGMATFAEAGVSGPG